MVVIVRIKIRLVLESSIVMMKPYVQDYERGQILLIVILVMVTALTVGLSVSSRTITNLRTDAEEENSERAFSAAEAGIEQALSTNAGSTGSFTNNSSYNTVISQLTGTEFLLNNGNPILKDDAVDVWLSAYPDYSAPRSGDFTVYWGNTSDICDTSESINTLPALEVIVISGTKANPLMTHYALDPCPQRVANNNFELVAAGGGTLGNKFFAYRKTLNINSGLLVRIIPLYSPAVIGVQGCDGSGNNCVTIPSQGAIITSTGTADNTQRKIVTYRGHPKLPTELFPYALFSPK